MMTRSKILVGRACVAAVATLIAGGTIAAGAHATPASGFTAVQQFKGVYPALLVKGEKTDEWDIKLSTKATSDVHVVRNTIAVGGQSGWHTHPGPSLITVTVGEVTAYESHDPLCQPKVYRAGEGFVDQGNHAHLLKNKSGAPAETVAVQFLPQGATRRIDQAQPNNCSF